jgi:hypothetical protein
MVKIIAWTNYRETERWRGGTVSAMACGLPKDDIKLLEHRRSESTDGFIGETIPD